ncbi:MAG TPA: hypothetical protein VFU06_10950 [Longimicrobiales bacterium]|nr:hypothetical protein [Longimicrobiales bacterium]
MRTDDLATTLALLFRELVHGAPDGGAFMLNQKDAGLLRSLDTLSAEAASARPNGGASIAAHVDHLRYGLTLMNRWAAGENPFSDADWSASWERQAVDEAEWEERRRALRREVEQWLRALAEPRQVNEVELAGMIGSIAHLAYHLGAMRQLDRAMRGPPASD